MHTGHRITFLRTLKTGCTLPLVATSVVLLTPGDAGALDLNLERTLSQTLGQVAQVTDSLTTSLGNTSTSKKQSGDSNSNTNSSSNANSNSRASNDASEQAAVSEPATPITPETPPAPEALPPEVEAVASIAPVPSRQYLLGLISQPLLGSFTNRPFITYPDADSFAVVRPSSEGWKILGIPWMWWVAGSGLVWMGNRWLIRRS